MKRFFSYRPLTVALTSVILTFGWNSCQTTKTPEPPDAKKIPKTLTIHGETRTDPYYWLRERDDTAVINYLEAENEYTRAVMEDTEELQDKLYEEIVGRIKQDDSTVPYKENGYFYYVRYESGGEYPVYCRKKESLDAKEEILLNGNEMARGYDYFDIGSTSVSPDNKLIAYSIDTVSRRNYTIYFKNLKTGEILPHTLSNTSGGCSWAADNKTVFYPVKNPETLRSERILRHNIDQLQSKDQEVFYEGDETYSCYVHKSKSNEYIIISSHSTLSTEYRLLDATTPEGTFAVVHPREKELEYHPYHFGDKFFILTNLDAPNFRLMEVPVSSPGKENWKEVIPHRKEVYLESIEIFNDYLVVQERREGLTQIRVMPWDDSDEHYIDFGEEAYVAGISTNPEFDSKKLRYGYSSMTTPYSVIDYDMETHEQELKKEQEVLGPFNKEDYETRRVFATARDSTSIPVTLVYRKGIDPEGNNPLLLYGYGSYGNTIEPYFSSARLSLLDRGFVYAIAHIRGGQIYGREWYEEGKMMKKKNTFTDFIDCAHFLINKKYTTSEKLYAMGGSAGGLLMGAIINMEPELFNGVVAAVPFVDVVTTMLDETIPLTTGEYDEWGNPNIKEHYDYILSYSPYDNIEPRNYPNLLVTTGLHDSQVQYWEPAKWVAKLRDVNLSENLILLETNMEAGHSGASGRFRRYRETALDYAFLLKLEGIEE
ncbi:S9 family peptidase [Marinilabilia sp.]|uniref:S9 family peptidase n=1 Tax=Marinilabilia sp. TaxID=2021252 RepID=UPI0025BE93A4|nr:S9 family peptidase [Marinilabilia sp.]